MNRLMAAGVIRGHKLMAAERVASQWHFAQAKLARVKRLHERDCRLGRGS